MTDISGLPKMSDSSEPTKSRGSRGHYIGGEVSIESKLIALIAKSKGVAQNVLLDALLKWFGAKNLLKVNDISKVSLQVLIPHASDEVLNQLIDLYPASEQAIKSLRKNK